MSESTVKVFFELVKAGLFSHTEITENTEKISWEGVDWGEVYRLAEEQSVIGLVSAGLDWFKVNDSRFTVPQAVALQFIGQTLQIEQRNKAMNAFVSDLITKLRKADIYAILVKGQGVAQCYKKPRWRCPGDVDLFLSDSNYENAKSLLLPTASHVDEEGISAKHLGMTIDGFVVELHGTLHGGLSSRVDGELDDVKNDTFYRGNVRSWNNNGVQIFLLEAENDVFYVFTHFLQHFYKEGVGLRQICDWCRLMWTYKDSLNHGLLESRIKRAGLMSEWEAFGAFVVEYLGMPVEDMPLLDVRCKKEDGRCEIDANLRKKADKICKFILEVGNFGHNRDNSYFQKHSYFIQKCISAWRRVKDLCRHATIFPLSSMRFFFGIMYNGIVSAVRGE